MILAWASPFKLCLYMYKAAKTFAPISCIYISDEVRLFEPKRTLRSSYAGPLDTVSVERKEVSDFDFAIKRPRPWNSLPMDLRSIRYDFQEKTEDIYLFKRQYYAREWKNKRFAWL